MNKGAATRVPAWPHFQGLPGNIWRAQVPIHFSRASAKGQYLPSLGRGISASLGGLWWMLRNPKCYLNRHKELMAGAGGWGRIRQTGSHPAFSQIKMQYGCGWLPSSSGERKSQVLHISCGISNVLFRSDPAVLTPSHICLTGTHFCGPVLHLTMGI